MWNIINIHNIAILLEVITYEKKLIYFPLIFVTLSCSSLNLLQRILRILIKSILHQHQKEYQLNGGKTKIKRVFMTLFILYVN